MPVDFTPRDPDRSQRVLQILVAALHFVLVGMLIYLRFVSLDRVFARFAEREVVIPAWLSLGLTLGILGMAGFLAVRGVLAFRRALRG